MSCVPRNALRCLHLVRIVRQQLPEAAEQWLGAFPACSELALRFAGPWMRLLTAAVRWRGSGDLALYELGSANPAPGHVIFSPASWMVARPRPPALYFLSPASIGRLSVGSVLASDGSSAGASGWAGLAGRYNRTIQSCSPSNEPDRRPLPPRPTSKQKACTTARGRGLVPQSGDAYSIGKDSTVLLHLLKRRSIRPGPLSLAARGTPWKFREMIAFATRCRTSRTSSCESISILTASPGHRPDNPRRHRAYRRDEDAGPEAGA